MPACLHSCSTRSSGTSWLPASCTTMMTARAPLAHVAPLTASACCVQRDQLAGSPTTDSLHQRFDLLTCHVILCHASARSFMHVSRSARLKRADTGSEGGRLPGSVPHAESMALTGAPSKLAPLQYGIKHFQVFEAVLVINASLWITIERLYLGRNSTATAGRLCLCLANQSACRNHPPE